MGVISDFLAILDNVFYLCELSVENKLHNMNRKEFLKRLGMLPES